MRAVQKSRRTTLVSFSGIDGAGKSTQIEALCYRLKEDGLRVLPIRFWDDVARLTRIREWTGHTMFKGDRGVGTTSAPINRRDKNVRSRLMTGLRLLLYFIDAISTRLAVAKALRSEADLVICDRYIYDELANLPVSNRAIQTYIRLMMRLVQKPDVAYFLDADPVQARARKPEYPLEFLHSNRLSYLALIDLVGGVTVISPMPILDVGQIVLRDARRALFFKGLELENDSQAAEQI